MFAKFVIKIFESFPVITKYVGVANIGAAIACFFEYGAQSFVFAYLGISILLIVLSVLAIRMVNTDHDYYDNEEVINYENI